MGVLMINDMPIGTTPDAKHTPFNPSGTDLTSTNVEDAIKEVNESERLRSQVGIPDEYDSETAYPEGGYCIENNKLYRATQETLGGGFDPTHWEATTVLEEIQKRIDIEREKIFTKIANNKLAIESELVINDSGDHLLVDDLGTILAVNQTVKFNFA